MIINWFWWSDFMSSCYEVLVSQTTAPALPKSYAYSLYTCVIVLAANTSRNSMFWRHVKGF